MYENGERERLVKIRDWNWYCRFGSYVYIGSKGIVILFYISKVEE